MDLHLKTEPGADTMTRVVQLSASDLADKKRHRAIHDLASFVAWVKRWAKPELATIYWTPAKVLAVLNEEDMVTGRGDQDTASFAFQRPIVADKWLAVVDNTAFNHKKFKDFLELRFNEIVGGAELFAKIANLSVATTFSYDGKLDDLQNYQIAFKSEAAGADVARLPKHIEVEIPLIQGLEKTYKLQLRLLFDPPKSADESPAFALKWDDRKEVLEQAARDAVDEIQAGLTGFLLVQGLASSRD